MERGVCTYSLIAQRKEPSHRSELVSQLLFGDAYEVLAYAEDHKWARVRTEYDQYEGYIDAKQHVPIDAAYRPTAITQGVCVLQGASTVLTIPAGCFVQMTGPHTLALAGEAYELQGPYGHLGQRHSPGQLVKNAHSYLKAPYLWGGKSCWGIDCSGFVQQVYKMGGFPLLRDAYQQATQGTEVAYGQHQAGDLAFFGEAAGQRVTHVGLVLEQQQIIHAHGEVRVDILDAEGIFNQKISRHTHNLLKINRIFRRS